MFRDIAETLVRIFQKYPTITKELQDFNNLPALRLRLIDYFTRIHRNNLIHIYSGAKPDLHTIYYDMGDGSIQKFFEDLDVRVNGDKAHFEALANALSFRQDTSLKPKTEIESLCLKLHELCKKLTENPQKLQNFFKVTDNIPKASATAFGIITLLTKLVAAEQREYFDDKKDLLPLINATIRKSGGYLMTPKIYNLWFCRVLYVFDIISTADPVPAWHLSRQAQPVANAAATSVTIAAPVLPTPVVNTPTSIAIPVALPEPEPVRVVATPNLHANHGSVIAVTGDVFPDLFSINMQPSSPTGVYFSGRKRGLNSNNNDEPSKRLQQNI